MAKQPDFVCPLCRGALAPSGPDVLACAADALSYQRIDGIWHFLLPERAAYFNEFIRDYETIRWAEGRGSREAAYYRALPHLDLSGRMQADWRIRAASFDALIKRIVNPAGRMLSVLDLGAGNGWLSNHLAEQGHSVTAVDILTNDFDGLGCYRFYESQFSPVQAEFDRLPFQDQAVDMVIFNASLHYSTGVVETLREALRVLARNGKLVVMDSPIYRDESSGEKMVRERELAFQLRFGTASNALPSQNYLTYSALMAIGKSLDIQWQVTTPFYGIEWHLRPLAAKLLGRREPAKFHLITGKKM